MKTCVKCKKKKPFTAFYRQKSRRDGYHPWRRDCARKSALDWQRKNPERHRQRCKSWHQENGLRKYGLSKSDYQEILNIQKNKCPICGTKSPLEWCVDHDHACCPGAKSCGKCIRGLLCRKCNAALGSFNDNTEVLERAIDYLRTYRILKIFQK